MDFSRNRDVFEERIRTSPKITNLILLLENADITDDRLVWDNDPKNRFGAWDYVGIIESLLNYYYDDVIIDKNGFKWETSFTGGTLIIKDSYLNKFHHNIKKVEFTSLYPHSMVKLWKDGKLTFNTKNFGELYSFLLENKTKVKRLGSTRAYTILKYILNYTYGIFASRIEFVRCNDQSLISSYSGDVLKELVRTDTSRNIVYVDTDTMYLHELSDDIKESLDALDLPYEVSDVHKFFPIAKKRYMVFDENDVMIENKGIFKFRREIKRR